ncbi:MAG: SUF system NifU family Fe-S cluster assembly protein [Candidatus Omnitrophica bacterium]|nr:SUF system NifU family Fe-S cluster assembly protein [Candidatus Omnitrophota bacterium]
MENSRTRELYQQVILDHNKNPRNHGKMKGASHVAEGYNPLCGDHLFIYLKIDKNNVIEDITFENDGCAISTASASMMTSALKGKTLDQSQNLFDQFHRLVLKELNPESEANDLGKLKIFSGIWQFPSRVKCATLCWHAMRGALNKDNSVTSE